MKQAAQPLQIAIDGPVAAGKSVVAKKVAEKTRLDYLNTGSMYRLLGVHIQKSNIAVHKEAQITAKLVAMQDAEFSSLSSLYHALDIYRTQLHRPEIAQTASTISRHKRVRTHMVALQKKLVKGRDIVVEGRDIGSIVLPHATLKIYLTAHIAKRATRRMQQLKQAGMNKSRKEVTTDIQRRDRRDTSRLHGPLVTVEDAIVIDTSNLAIDAVVNRITDLMKKQ